MNAPTTTLPELATADPVEDNLMSARNLEPLPPDLGTIQAQRATFQRDLADARRRHAAEAYLAQSGAESDVVNAKAAVDRLEGALEHLSVIETEAHEAAERAAREETERRRQAWGEQGKSAISLALGAAGELDAVLDELLKRWAVLDASLDAYYQAVRQLTPGGEKWWTDYSQISDIAGHAAKRIAGLAYLEGLALPEGAAWARSAQQVQGQPNSGRRTVRELVESELSRSLTRVGQPELQAD